MKSCGEGKGREGKGRKGKGWTTGQVVDKSLNEITFKLLDRNVVGVFKN